MTFSPHDRVAIYSGSFELFSFTKRCSTVPLDINLPSISIVQLNTVKKNDIRSLFKYLIEEKMAWFEEILTNANQQNMAGGKESEVTKIKKIAEMKNGKQEKFVYHWLNYHQNYYRFHISLLKNINYSFILNYLYFV